MGTNLWEQAIQKDMENMRVDLDKISHVVDEMSDGKCLPGFQEIICHMILEINMYRKFTCTARLVVGIHTTDPPESITDSNFVSRDSVRITFIIAALDYLGVYATNIGNAYLNAICR